MFMRLPGKAIVLRPRKLTEYGHSSVQENPARTIETLRGTMPRPAREPHSVFERCDELNAPDIEEYDPQ
jgi:hypothetical protein